MRSENLIEYSIKMRVEYQIPRKKKSVPSFAKSENPEKKSFRIALLSGLMLSDTKLF